MSVQEVLKELLAGGQNIVSLAAKMGVHPITIQRWEKGETRCGVIETAYLERLLKTQRRVFLRVKVKKLEQGS